MGLMGDNKMFSPPGGSGGDVSNRPARAHAGKALFTLFIGVLGKVACVVWMLRSDLSEYILFEAYIIVQK